MNTIQFMYALVEITDCYFSDNKADERTKNIFIGFSTVSITNTIFKDASKSNPITLAKAEQTQGAFIFAILDVFLYVNKCKFYQGIAL
jgi:hypothetical protein